MMNDGFMPWAAVGTVRQEAGIEVMSPGPERHLIDRVGAVITDQESLVWALLGRCTGRRPLKRILEEVGKEFPDLDGSLIEAALHGLVRRGVVVDSRVAFAAFMPLMANPPWFARSLSAEEVRRYTRSPRLPVRAGIEVCELAQRDTELARLQALRRSCRAFAGRPVGLGDLGHVLVSGCSLVNHATASAGGLYPLKVYVIVVAADGELPQGYYEYDQGTHTLHRFPEPLDDWAVAFAFDSDMGPLPHGAPAAVVVGADMERDPGKYANRGFLYTILEAGLVSATITLAATELGIATLPYGGYLDDPLAAELRMNDDREEGRVRPLLSIMLGYPGQRSSLDLDRQLEALERALVGRRKPLRDVYLSRGRRPGNASTFVVATARLHGRRAAATGRAPSWRVAKLKALAEGFEWWASGQVRVDVEASGRELSERGLAWLDPRVIAPLTAEQYACRPTLQPFNDADPWQWVTGRHLDGHGQVLVPIDLAFFPLDTTPWTRKRVVAANSSGVAAHTTAAHATELALLELIERDALMRTWFSHRPPPRISTGQLAHHWQRRVEYWQQQGRRVEVLDLSRNGVAVANVVIVSDQHPCFYSGMGASLRCFADAAAKAFQEAESFVEARVRYPFKRRISPHNVKRVVDHARLYAFPDHIDALEWLWDGPEATSPSEPAATADELYRRLEAVAVALSPPEAPLHVVRVLSAHLIPINFGHDTTHHTHHTLEGEVAPASLALPHYFA
jgi:thiazole/oxazole-forming peptide maturase SagD family component